MQDVLGQEIEVGDPIWFASASGRSSAVLELGIMDRLPGEGGKSGATVITVSWNGKLRKTPINYTDKRFIKADRDNLDLSGMRRETAEAFLVELNLSPGMLDRDYEEVLVYPNSRSTLTHLQKRK